MRMSRRGLGTHNKIVIGRLALFVLAAGRIHVQAVLPRAIVEIAVLCDRPGLLRAFPQVLCRLQLLLCEGLEGRLLGRAAFAARRAVRPIVLQQLADLLSRNVVLKANAALGAERLLLGLVRRLVLRLEEV